MNPSSLLNGLASPLLVRSTIKKSLITFLAIFGSAFYVGNEAGR